jgi:hypothetical protein
MLAKSPFCSEPGASQSAVALVRHSSRIAVAVAPRSTQFPALTRVSSQLTPAPFPARNERGVRDALKRHAAGLCWGRHAL